MNIKLTHEIVKHIFSNFGIIQANFINYDKTKSLIDKDFLINQKILFEDEFGYDIENKVWAIELNIDNKYINIIIADCRTTENINEYAMIFQMQDAPAYGIYYSDISEDINSESIISCSIGEDSWLDCNVFLQSNFLSGTEQLKEYIIAYKKLEKYDEQYKLLISFLKYHEDKFNIS